MIVTNRITEKQYIGLQFTLAYRRALTFVTTIVGILLLLFYAITHFGPFGRSSEKMLFPLFFGVWTAAVTPLLIYFSAKKNFRTNKAIKENITYEITGSTLKVSGETFTGETNLYNAYRILEINNWFIIYQSNAGFYMIPKKNLSVIQITELREIFGSLQGIHVTLLQ